MLFNLKPKFHKSTTPLLILLGVIVLLGIFFPFFRTQAIDLIDFGSDLVLKAIGFVASLIINLLGSVLGLLIGILVNIAQYNHFVDACSKSNPICAPSVVRIGWGIVRDGCNMLFIIGIMIIAFGTILKIQTYHARNLLVKFVIMAVIINFSKTITGLFIDFSQVVMLTFVNSFANTAPIVLVVGLGIKKMISLSTTSGTVGFMSVIGSMILAVILLLVACCVVFAFIVVLLARIIMIWILVILSPIAYAATVLPNTQKYSSAWWSSLGKNLVSGPLLAFFLWLSLFAIAESSAEVIKLEEGSVTPVKSGGASEMMGSQSMLNFIVAIALLITGLMMTQSLGVMGGQIAGNMVNRLQSAGIGALKTPLKMGSWGARKLKAKTGVDINPASIYRTMKAGFARKKMLEEEQGMVKAGQRLEKGGLLGAVGGLGAASWVDNYAQGFLWRKGIQKVAPASIGIGKARVQLPKFLGLGRGKESRITDMFAERDRRQKAIDEKREQAEAKNPNERYLEAREQEKAGKQEEVANIDSRVGDIDAILNARETEARKLETNADKLEKKAQKDFDSGEISELEYNEEKKTAAKMRKDAAEKRTKPLTEEEIEQEKKLQGEKTMISLEKQDLVLDLGNIDAEISAFKTKGVKEQNNEAARYFKDMADRRKTERDRLAQGGLTREQKTKRDEEVKALDKSIRELAKDISNMRALGKDTKQKQNLIDKFMKQRAEKVKYIADENQSKTNQSEIEKLEKEEVDLRKEAEKAKKGEYMSEDQRMAIRRETEKMEKDLQEYSREVEEEAAYRPIDFIAQQERRAQNEEAARKYRTENEAELRAYMKNALQRHNVNDAAAVALQAARVGHLNELVNDFQATEDWYEDAKTGQIVRKGEAAGGSRLVFKKGDYLTAGIEGLHTYMNEIFDNVFKYGRKATLALENDLSETAKEINHWTFAEAIGSKEDGRFVQRPRATQQAHAYVERSKRDFENLYRQGNRLAIGTEEWIDPNNHKLGRKATLNEYAVMELSNKWPALKGLIARGRFNASAAEHIMQHNKPIVDYIQRDALVSGRAKDWREVKGGWETLGGQAGEVRNLTQEIRRMADILKKTSLRG